MLLGSLPEFRRDPMQMLKHLQEEYGDVVHFRLVQHHCYLFSRPEDVRYVLRTNSKNFKKAFLFEKMRVLLGNGLLPMTYEDDFWRSRRRLSQPPFHTGSLESYAATWAPATAEFLDHWQKHVEGRSCFDALEEMYSLSFDLAARTLLGSTGPSAETEAVRRAFDVALEHIKHKIEDAIDLPEWIPTPRNRRFLAARRTIDRVVYRLIERRREEGAAASDFLGTLIDAFDTEADVDARQLRDEVMTMFIAGFETVASALAWSLWLLARNPEWQERLRGEVDTVLKGRQPGLADLNRLELTRMVLDETMRLYPPAWWVVRAAIEDDEIGGVEVPAGSLVILSQYVTHRHPEFWDRPDEFDPMRFAADAVRERPGLAFFPFGDGPRSCIGARFSYLQMAIVLAMVLQRYRVSPLPGHEVGFMASATMRPSNRVPIFVAPSEADRSAASGEAVSTNRRPSISSSDGGPDAATLRSH